MQNFTSDQFTWDGRTGSAEASDLGVLAGQELPRHFIVKSEKTGDALTFWAESQEVREGDLLWTVYTAVACGKYVHIRLYND